MNFEENEQITMLRETLRRFIDRELSREEARRLDAIADYSPETFKKLCELGVTGLNISEE